MKIGSQWTLIANTHAVKQKERKKTSEGYSL